MNKFFKVAIIVFAIVILVLGVFYVKSFVIGSDSYEGVNIDKVTLSNNSIEINGNFTDSGRAYKSYSYTQVSTELYVTITSVSVSNKYNNGQFQISIPVSGNMINNIHLTDGSKTKVIYSK